MKIEKIAIDKLLLDPANARKHGQKNLDSIKGSLAKFGQQKPIVVNADNVIVAGNGTLQAAKELGWKEINIVRTDLKGSDITAFGIADNRTSELAEWDDKVLQELLEGLKAEDFDLSAIGFDDEDFAKNMRDEQYADGKAGKMSSDFGQPPFSILDTRKGDWLERKRHWRDLIGDNGESREGTLGIKIAGEINSGVSLLDPVLAEIIVGWFGLIGGVAFDPFAGDTIFGFVAGHSGMNFKGIELRKEQASLNQARCDAAELPCKYYCDSSENMNKYIDESSVDLVFSCPPYADLEIYSDNPLDLSNMSHDNFFKIYAKILQNTFSRLKNNRFAVIVMGEVRNKKGEYIGTIPNTIKIMESAGYAYYNEIILVNCAGTLPLRAGKTMRSSRKVGKMHQNILVFLKGDAKKAVADLGDIKIAFGDLNENEG